MQDLRPPIRHTNRIQRHQSDGIEALNRLCRHCALVIQDARTCQSHLRESNIAGDDLKVSIGTIALLESKGQ